MKISYDSEVDALSIVFRDTTVTSKHLAEGIAADYDTDGRLAGIEILDAMKRFGDRETLRKIILEGIEPSAAVVRHARPVIFQMAEVAIPRELFRAILEGIGRLRWPTPLSG